MQFLNKNPGSGAQGRWGGAYRPITTGPSPYNMLVGEGSPGYYWDAQGGMAPCSEWGLGLGLAEKSSLGEPKLI